MYRYFKVLLLAVVFFAGLGDFDRFLGAKPGGGPVFAGEVKLDSSLVNSRLNDTTGQPKAVVTTPHGSYVFTVEVARTTPEKSKGLMYRQEMAASAGMVFVFDSPQLVSMWMRNTYIALDMLFIGADGRILNIAANTVPMSKTIISSGSVTKWVLELNAGSAARFNFKVGDRVTFTGI